MDSSLPGSRSQALRILVIDDDPATLSTVGAVLRAGGHQTFDAGDGASGIERAQSLLPDLIICDVTMPGIDGYDVLRALKRNLATAAIPFIFLSGHLDEDFVRQGMGLGADDYLAKPFLPEQLFASIRARMERQRIVTAKLDQLRGSLVRAVPAEFFTPLNAVLGFSMLLLDNLRTGMEISRDDLEDSLTGIHEAGEQLFRIASNYVLFAQLSSQEDLAHPAAPALAPDAWEPALSAAVRKHAMQRQRTKDLHYSFARCPLRIRQEHLEKLVIELLDNAIKFSRAGEWLSVTGVVQDDRYVLRVADHGRGMTSEQIASTAPMVQFDRQHLVQSGVGLGLQIARLLARRYEGELSIRRNTDRGITVEVNLPVGA
ncbi:MAG: response regulator [Opitutaceae bacterium]|nr:response regulator [Opitutaceae bacterium]